MINETPNTWKYNSGHVLQIEVPKAVGVLYNSLLSIPAELLAKQLTWMEHEIYSRIKP